MATQIQLRRGTAAQWSSVNPILAVAEMGVVIGSGAPMFKVGDGVTRWNDLPYGGVTGPAGAQGPQGVPGERGPAGNGLDGVTVLAPLVYNQNANTLGVEDPLVIDGMNF